MIRQAYGFNVHQAEPSDFDHALALIDLSLHSHKKAVCDWMEHLIHNYLPQRDQHLYGAWAPPPGPIPPLAMYGYGTTSFARICILATYT